MFNITEKSIQIGDNQITIETGRIARQAGGSVLVTCGGTQVLVTATAAKEAQVTASFFPLSVDYIEKFYSAGRIPGGYIKRETRPSDREILISRLIDRPIRPLFPETYLVETQVIAKVVSLDPKISPSQLAILGASCALHISDIPFAGPVAGVRVGFKDGKYLINPPESELPSSDLDLVVAGTKDAILMVEAAANFLTEAQILEAIEVGHKEIKKLCHFQDEIREKCGKEKREVPDVPQNAEMKSVLSKKYAKALKDAYAIASKSDRKKAIDAVKKEAKAELVEAGNTESEKAFSYLFEMQEYKILRNSIIKDNYRVDGRSTKDVRNIDCQTSVLKRTHGSALFTRGETQSLGVVTLGTHDDAQRSESIMNVLEEKTFMLHYNMPGYSVGEVKRLGSPGRREVGHGNLAERALKASLPTKNRFPYSIRIVSEITESNGSSSMASVCSGTLSMLDAGVPLKEPIAGIAMGLILEGKEYAILSDILGDEDHLGDMDFKVAGGKNGITAMQMDIKISGISMEILEKALAQAKDARILILDKMLRAISRPNDLSQLAPRIEQIKIKPERVRDLIGPGGKNIKKIVSDTGCKLEVNDEGIVSIASTDGNSAAKAKRMVNYLTTDPEIGEIYLGIVKKTADFGAFVEIKPGVEGLVHISQLAATRINKTEEVVKEGDEVMVKVIELDRTGRIKLSRKDAIGKTPSNEGTRPWVL
ncbi:polyribonucleotide nucleotidyltransferase [Silvanigrella paludirubra]|uniref:Polyribonucleotide nucleotidyltransferase n=1 Tax=Silvanigrella paludirubra TaxID=2499159 RepID=A0A6N6VY66_9BACT|nr:polyribonucleotide nucleotidyltransferase [Silvanigrella paludirubra]KAB8039045.1 polyribonucleotide nucleotidyltransferase [Silvanigrella paludirubra]